VSKEGGSLFGAVPGVRETGNKLWNPCD
jgi:hypothetical protein